VAAGRGIEQALSRFETVMSQAWPAWFARLGPGLDDAGIQRLRDAVAPYLVPPQVEALYRWRDGGDHGVFGGWRMRPLDELLEWYRFTCDDLESPPTWLPVFEDQIVNVVTLDVPGLAPSDPSVWYGHTHDMWLSRLFDSIAALLDVVADAAEAGALVERDQRLGLSSGGHVHSLDGEPWTSWRLDRCPDAFRWPDPPAGTHRVSLPDPDWPREWLEPLGVTQGTLALRGATHSIAELVAAAASGPVRGTIRGRVVSGVGTAGWWSPVVSDGSGRITVHCETRRLPVMVVVGSEGEFDVVLESAESPEPAAVATAARPIGTP
jgi:cell wall assembly regulator SMI1